MEKKKNVLVVDDERGVLRFVKIALNAAGFQVTTAESGEEALLSVQEQEPDIMLLDVFMSPMTGFEVLTRLRSFSHLPVIGFSARSSVADQVLKSGANAFIAKPFRPEDLVRKIKETLAW